MLACVSMFPLDTYYHSACALIHVVFNGVIGVIVKFRVRFQSVTLNCILSICVHSTDFHRMIYINAKIRNRETLKHSN